MAAAEKKVTNITTKQDDLLKAAFEINDRYDTLTLMLEPLPDLLQMIIERYHLDMAEPTKGDIDDLGNSHKQLFTLLSLVRDTILSFQGKASSIDYRAIINDL